MGFVQGGLYRGREYRRYPARIRRYQARIRQLCRDRELEVDSLVSSKRILLLALSRLQSVRCSRIEISE